MTDAEGLMWRLEKDPYLSSTFGNVTILDRKIDFDHLRRRMDRAVHVIPRLRQRVQPAPANLNAPLWVDDPQFDLDYHVRHLALPKPGSVRQLLDLATLITADPFDRTRPLWQFVLVDGLSKGRSALIEKLHHTITDGEGSVKLSLQFLDFERDAPEPPSDHGRGRSRPRSTRTVRAAEAMRDLVAGSLRMPIGILRQFRDLLADPAQMPSASAAAADTVRGILSQLSDVDQARSPLWTAAVAAAPPRGAALPASRTRSWRAKRLGGTLNTAFMTAAAHAASEYHRGARRSRSSSSGPRWRSAPAPTRPGRTPSRWPGCSFPTGDMPIAERFRAIHEATTAAREAVEDRDRSRRSPRSPPPCRPRSSPGWPASRRRPSTSRPRT